MSGPSIRVTADFYAIQVRINDTLHVHVDRPKLLGVQSWCDHEASYSIEYVMAGGSLLTEYTEQERWQLILAGLEGVL